MGFISFNIFNGETSFIQMSNLLYTAYQISVLLQKYENSSKNILFKPRGKLYGTAFSFPVYNLLSK